jgi:hypothetical protein
MLMFMSLSSFPFVEHCILACGVKGRHKSWRFGGVNNCLEKGYFDELKFDERRH